MVRIRIDDIADEAGFRAIPPCADPGFDHRSCDFWEDADRGSKAARLSWLKAPQADVPPPVPRSDNPFLAERPSTPTFNPFLVDDDEAAPNPFAPVRSRPEALDAGTPAKLRLLLRGRGITGSYAKVLYADDVAAAYCQFGPLTAYPRAQRTRELYPQLPDAPLPAVITCIATTAAARGTGLGRMLVTAVCDDLAARGFSAVEAYPETGARPDATSAATPAFWEALGFERAVDDSRFPVMRRRLG